MSFITWTIEFCIISTVSTPTSFLNSSPKGSADFTVLKLDITKTSSKEMVPNYDKIMVICCELMIYWW